MLQCFLPSLGPHNSSAIQLAIRAGIIRVECVGLSDSELSLNNKSILRTNHFVYLPSLRSRVASNKFRLWHLVAFFDNQVKRNKTTFETVKKESTTETLSWSQLALDLGLCFHPRDLHA